MRLIKNIYDIKNIVKSAQKNYELTMEVVNFARDNNLSTNGDSVSGVVKLASFEKNIALNLYKQSHYISSSDASNLIDAFKANKELTQKLISFKDKYNNKLKPIEIRTITYATQKSPDFMKNINEQADERKLTLNEYFDISMAVCQLNGDFAYKTVDELTDTQKRILLNEISSRKHST